MFCELVYEVSCGWKEYFEVIKKIMLVWCMAFLLESFNRVKLTDFQLNFQFSERVGCQIRRVGCEYKSHVVFGKVKMAWWTRKCCRTHFHDPTASYLVSKLRTVILALFQYDVEERQ